MIHTKATLGIWVNSPLMTFLKVSWSGRPPFSHFRNWIGFWMQNFLLLILHIQPHVTVAQKHLSAVVECAADKTGQYLVDECEDEKLYFWKQMCPCRTQRKVAGHQCCCWLLLPRSFLSQSEQLGVLFLFSTNWLQTLQINCLRKWKLSSEMMRCLTRGIRLKYFETRD